MQNFNPIHLNDAFPWDENSFFYNFKGYGKSLGETGSAFCCMCLLCLPPRTRKNPQLHLPCYHMYSHPGNLFWDVVSSLSVLSEPYWTLLIWCAESLGTSQILVRKEWTCQIASWTFTTSILQLILSSLWMIPLYHGCLKTELFTSQGGSYKDRFLVFSGLEGEGPTNAAFTRTMRQNFFKAVKAFNMLICH